MTMSPADPSVAYLPPDPLTLIDFGHITTVECTFATNVLTVPVATSATTVVLPTQQYTSGHSPGL